MSNLSQLLHSRDTLNKLIEATEEQNERYRARMKQQSGWNVIVLLSAALAIGFSSLTLLGEDWAWFFWFVVVVSSATCSLGTYIFRKAVAADKQRIEDNCQRQNDYLELLIDLDRQILKLDSTNQ